MITLKKIFEILLDKFGYQGWWPVTPTCGCKGEAVLPIYGVKGKTDKQKLEIILGAILTQNTAWKNVEKSIIELNKKNLIDIDKIIRVKHEELGKTIRSSGYYNEKSKKLKNVSVFLKRHPIQRLEEIEPFKARELLLSVKGIGPETADSILLYALEKPIFVIDAYTKRAFERIGFNAETYDEWQKLFMDNLPKDVKLFNEYHALIVEFGKNYCKKKPICEGCPITAYCEFYAKNKSFKN